MTKFFTFAPGKAPAGKQSEQIALKPGQHLAFKQGSGYYAADGAAPGTPGYVAPAPTLVSENGAAKAKYINPQTGLPTHTPPPAHTIAVAAPKPPVSPYAPLTDAQIQAQAGLIAQQGLTPQQDEVRRQQALAAQQAASQEAGIQGFQTAASQLMQGIAPQVGAGYQAAAKTEGDVGTAVGGKVGQDLAAQQATDDAFAASQGQSGGHTLSAPGVGSSVAYLGGYIPSASLAQQGAAQQAFAAEQSAIPLDAGREQLAARMSQAVTDNDNYAQQLIQLAQQYPGLKAQALQQLNQYELEKANARQQVRMNDANVASARAAANERTRMDNENIKTTDANIANAKADNIRQNKALDANIKAAGLDAQTKAQAAVDANAYKIAGLEVQTQKAKLSAQIALAKIKAEGLHLNASGSSHVGYMIDNNGHPILDAAGKRIPVKQTTETTPNQKAVVNRSKAVEGARTHAAGFALKTMGKPVVSKGGKGRYVADPSQKYNVPGGVFPPAFPGDAATTNDPSRALRNGGTAANYKQAQDQVYQEIGGKSLEGRYNLSHAQVMEMVNKALEAAGWTTG
jgi:hypothetical protein